MAADAEEALLRSVALQNTQSILVQIHWPLTTDETAGPDCVEFLDGERFHRNS